MNHPSADKGSFQFSAMKGDRFLSRYVFYCCSKEPRALRNHLCIELLTDISLTWAPVVPGLQGSLVECI